MRFLNSTATLNKLIMKTIQIIAGIIGIALAGCGRSDSSNTQQTKVPPEAASANRAAEKYGPLVDASLLVINIQATRTAQDAYGNTTSVGGKIDSVLVGSKRLELKTDTIVHDSDGDWVDTKDYGRIRVGGPGQGAGPWVTASQEAQFRNLIQSK
jgi:hypothetical protein